MTEPRRSTVYDYSDLRLHPNGTRVYQRDGNLRPKIVKVAVQTARSNWIARDAGGTGSVRRFKPRLKNPLAEVNAQEERGEVFEEVEEDVQNESGEENVEGEAEEPAKAGEKRKSKRIDGRKGKRQKFLDDFAYLASEESPPPRAAPGAISEPTAAPNLVLPEPSGDLLKCIHRFASEFYTERGQLLNSSRAYRLQRRAQARLRREQQREENGSTGSQPPSESSSSSSSETESDSELERDEEEEEEEAHAGEDITGKGKGKARAIARKQKRKRYRKGRGPGRKRAEKHYVDMYKVFDGSAILALGMLVQEQIAQLLATQPLPGWEEEMRKAYGEEGTEEFLEEDMGDASGLDGDGANSVAGLDADQSVEETQDESHEAHEDEEDRKDEAQELGQDKDEEEVELPAAKHPHSRNEAPNANHLPHAHHNHPLRPDQTPKLTRSDNSPAEQDEERSEGDEEEDRSDLGSMIENDSDDSERSTDSGDPDAEGGYS